jgi:hypothetical protein
MAPLVEGKSGGEPRERREQDGLRAGDDRKPPIDAAAVGAAVPRALDVGCAHGIDAFKNERATVQVVGSECPGE